MGLVASGKKKVKGLSKEDAKEYIRGQKRDNLPERIEKFVAEKRKERKESLPYNQGTYGVSTGVGVRP